MPDSLPAGPKGAVFLSYASQDAEAAKRICEALRKAGIEVWFDQSQLRGGDAWDQSIRRQIKECALFMPVVSQHTQERLEGYFRREWNLATQRLLDMAHDAAFVVPVVIDGTRDAEARVPDEFLRFQWTRLPEGETPAVFGERVKKLLSGSGAEQGRASPAASGSASAPHPAKTSRPWVIPSVIGLVAILLIVFMLRPRRSPKEVADLVAMAQRFSEPSPAPVSEARQLMQRAGAIWENKIDKTSDMLEAAEELYTRALALDPSDAEIWAAAARLDPAMVSYAYDQSNERRQKAQKEAARAAALAPGSFATRHAQACVLSQVGGTPAMLAEAENMYRKLLLEKPSDHLLIAEFGVVLTAEHKNDEAAALLEKSGRTLNDMGFIQEAGWNFEEAGKFGEARRIADYMLSQQRTWGALALKSYVEGWGFEDLTAAQAAISQFTPEELLLDGPAYGAVVIALFRREPDEAIRLLNEFPRENFSTHEYSGPKRAFSGVAHQLAGRPEAAQAEWRVALQQVQDLLKAKANDPNFIAIEAYLLACLGEAEEAGRVLKLYESLSRLGPNSPFNFAQATILLRLGRKEEVLARLSTALKTKDFPWLHPYVRFAPDFDPLRGDPRFEKLLRDTLPPGAKPFDEPVGKAASAPESGR